MTSRPHLWFAGTPAFAAHSLEVLLADPAYQITGVLTQPDRPAGRGRKLTASAVKEVALAHDLPLAQPAKLRDDQPPFPEQPRPDLIIVAAYGLLLPPWFLDLPRLGCINIHASLLPRWRGAAPIQRAIAAGDSETGISIMQMDAGLDTGPVWLTRRLPIRDDDTAASLHDRLMTLGADALRDALPNILRGDQRPTAQSADGATYAHKLHKAEAAIDWQESASAISRKIRAYTPYPVAYATLNGQRILFHHAHPVDGILTSLPPGSVLRHDHNGLCVKCGDGVVCITQLQLPGKKTTSAAALANSRDLSGEQLT